MGDERRSRFQALAGDHWNGFLKGIEKEGLRVDRNGFIAQTPHPESLGSALTHPSITTDYSEALLELITPVCRSTDELMTELREVHAFVQRRLGDEVMWANSMPCELDGDPSIPIAEYGTSNIGRLKHVYRQGLAVRYGRVMQSIAGIHYNFSLPDDFWARWQAASGDHQSLQDFKTEQYFWLIRNFRRRSWLLMLLFGASPALDASFVAGKNHGLQSWDERSFYSPVATSLRMGDLGYHNNAQSSLDICFNRLDSYLRTLDRAIHTPWPPYERIGQYRDGQPIQINTNVLQIENEYYSAMRPKRTTHRGEKPIQALRSRGVEYVEVRCLDLDPFEPLGLSAQSLDFMDVFLLDCLLSDSPWIDDRECEFLDNDFKDVVSRGRDPKLQLQFEAGAHPVNEGARRLLDRLGAVADILDGVNGGQTYRLAVKAQEQKVTGDTPLPSTRSLDALSRHGGSYLAWNLDLSRRHQEDLRAQGLDAVREQEMVEEAARSRDEQHAMEAAEVEDFDSFLARYLMT
ncbi:glutamate--cysteine ligase [Marinobacteraceae bacterium S3BR75-40.1]